LKGPLFDSLYLTTHMHKCTHIYHNKGETPFVRLLLYFLHRGIWAYEHFGIVFLFLVLFRLDNWNISRQGIKRVVFWFWLWIEVNESILCFSSSANRSTIPFKTFFLSK